MNQKVEGLIPLVKNTNNYMYEKWSKYIEEDPYYNKNFSKMGVYMLDRSKEGGMK